MDLWFTEKYGDKAGITLKIKETLYHQVSPYQTVDVIDTEAYGRMLLLDGLVMTTEKDEFIYHEMIGHIPLLAHPNPKRVLVIGGGDGGTIREVLKHPSVEQAVLCEIDQLVIDSCREFLPSIAGQLDDPRVDIQVGDGVAFVAKFKNHFDVILIDSTDPLGPGVGLFTEEFYRNVSDALTENGIMAAQSESPMADPTGVRLIYDRLRLIFPVTESYVSYVPTYPSGYWSWAFCSKGIRPLDNIDEARATTIEKTTKYYNRQLHEAVFALPNFVKELVHPQKVPTGATTGC